MSELDDLEELAEQASFRINQDARTKHCAPGRKLGWSIAPNIEHAAVPRGEKTAASEPRSPSIPQAQAPIVVNFSAAEVTSYTELIGGIQARIGELGIRQVDFDDLAGFAPGLSGKVFGPSQVKRLGPEKLFDAIRAAGLRLRLEPDPEQLEKMQKQIVENCQPRQAKQARPGNLARPGKKVIDAVLGYLANNAGGLTQLNAAMKEARSNWGRHAAKAREQKRQCGSGDLSAAA
jgi:hypothetical protein